MLENKEKNSRQTSNNNRFFFQSCLGPHDVKWWNFKKNHPPKYCNHVPRKVSAKAKWQIFPEAFSSNIAS